MSIIYLPDDLEKLGKKEEDPFRAFVKWYMKKQKHEQKVKEKKSKPQTVSLGAMTSMIMLLSIPITLGQIWLLDFVKEILKNGFPHH